MRFIFFIYIYFKLNTQKYSSETKVDFSSSLNIMRELVCCIYLEISWKEQIAEDFHDDYNK